MVIKVNEFSRGIIEQELADGVYVCAGLRLPPEQIYRIRPSQQEIPNTINQALKKGDFEIPDDYSPSIATSNSTAVIARELGSYAVLAVATGQIDDTGKNVVVGYRYFWLNKVGTTTLDGIKTLLHWWWSKNCPCFEINPAVWEQQTKSKDFYNAVALDYDYEALLAAKVPDYIPIVVQISEGEELNIQSLEKLHYQALQLYKCCDILVNNTRQECPLAWAWNVTCLTYPSRFTAIVGISGEGMDIVQNQLQGVKKLQCRVIEKHQQLEIISNTNPEVMVNEISCEFVPYEDIKKLLINIANNPSNNKKIAELLSCLGAYSPDIWSSCFDKESISQAQTNPSVNTLNYRALAALLAPNVVPEWLSWVRANKIIKDSLLFQEEIWETCRSNATGRENLRCLIRAGIAELLCELTKSAVSEATYQNIEYLLVKEQKQNVWHDRFRSYTKDILDRLPNLLSVEPDSHKDSFYSLLGHTFKKLEKSEWKSIYPEYLKIAKLIEKYGNYELAAVFFQISSGGVPGNVWGGMSKVDSQTITEYIPLKKGNRS